MNTTWLQVGSAALQPLKLRACGLYGMREEVEEPEIQT